jgi:hypothetical protein
MSECEARCPEQGQPTHGTGDGHFPKLFRQPKRVGAVPPAGRHSSRRIVGSFKVMAVFVSLPWTGFWAHLIPAHVEG